MGLGSWGCFPSERETGQRGRVLNREQGSGFRVQGTFPAESRAELHSGESELIPDPSLLRRGQREDDRQQTFPAESDSQNSSPALLLQEKGAFVTSKKGL
jgi:hypothetical protein